MAFFNEFPHTRTYDSDLAWLIKRMKEILSRMDSLEDRMKALEDLVTDFINTANIPQLIADEVQKMIDDGRIDEIVARLIRELTAIQDWGTPVIRMNNTGWKTSLFSRNTSTSIDDSYTSTLGLRNVSLYKANGKKRLYIETGAGNLGSTGSTIDTMSPTDNKLLFEFITETTVNPSVVTPFIGENVEAFGKWNSETVTVTCNFGSAEVLMGFSGSTNKIGYLRSISVLATPTSTFRSNPTTKIITLEDFDMYDTP